MRKRALFLAAALALLPLWALAEPVEPMHAAYTYNAYGESVLGPAPYEIKTVFGGDGLSIGGFNGLSDVYFSPGGDLFIADTGNNRIVVLDREYRLKMVYEGVKTADGLSAFNQPKAVCLGPDRAIFVCDTYNSRIVKMNDAGELLAVYGAPQSDLLEEGQNYRPLKAAVDNSGRIYVVAASINDGILMLNPDGSFEGFLAAARVSPDPIRLLWKRLATKEQRSRMEDFVPVEYNSLALDGEGFVYATTAAVNSELIIGEVAARAGTEEGAVVRRLNMLGQDILRRKGFFPQVGDVENLSQNEPFFKGVSQFLDVAAADNGVYYLLDNNRKRVFAYDQDGYLLYAFSGPGNSQGGFTTPAALDLYGNDLAVADRGTNLITIFTRTAYGRTIDEAIASYNRGDYAKSTQLWRQVMERNANFDMAYAGLGKVAYRDGDYQAAMGYFETADLKEWYSKAFKEYRKTILSRWFGPVLLVLIAVFLAKAAYSRLRRRKEGLE